MEKISRIALWRRGRMLQQSGPNDDRKPEKSVMSMMVGPVALRSMPRIRAAPAMMAISNVT